MATLCCSWLIGQCPESVRPAKHGPARAGSGKLVLGCRRTDEHALRYRAYVRLGVPAHRVRADGIADDAHAPGVEDVERRRPNGAAQIGTRAAMASTSSTARWIIQWGGMPA